MPQIDKLARKLYNNKLYLKNKCNKITQQLVNRETNTKDLIEESKDLIKEIPIQIESNHYYLLKFYKNIQVVNNSFLDVQLKPLVIVEAKKDIDYKLIYDNVIVIFKTLDKTEEFIKYFNRVAYIKGMFCYSIKPKPFRNSGSTEFSCVFGTMCISNYKTVTYDIVNKNLKPNFYKRWFRSGVEVLGMKPNQTKDGKYRYDGISTEQLKKACKLNGIKSYSKLDKYDLVKLLLKV